MRGSKFCQDCPLEPSEDRGICSVCYDGSMRRRIEPLIAGPRNLLKRMLHPEDLGWAVSDEVRALVKEELAK